MRYLTWYIKAGEGEAGSTPGPTIRLDRDYTPKAAWVYQVGAPSSKALWVDINVDGVSIFVDAEARPHLHPFENESYVEDVGFPEIAEGSLVTVALDERGDGSGGVTVILELEE